MLVSNESFLTSYLCSKGGSRSVDGGRSGSGSKWGWVPIRLRQEASRVESSPGQGRLGCLGWEFWPLSACLPAPPVFPLPFHFPFPILHLLVPFAICIANQRRVGGVSSPYLGRLAYTRTSSSFVRSFVVLLETGAGSTPPELESLYVQDGLLQVS